MPSKPAIHTVPVRSGWTSRRLEGAERARPDFRDQKGEASRGHASSTAGSEAR